MYNTEFHFALRITIRNSKLTFQPLYVNGFNYGPAPRPEVEVSLVSREIEYSRGQETRTAPAPDGKENALKNRQVDGITQGSSIFVSSFTLINVILLLIARESRAARVPRLMYQTKKRIFYFTPSPPFFPFIIFFFFFLFLYLRSFSFRMRMYISILQTTLSSSGGAISYYPVNFIPAMAAH